MVKRCGPPSTGWRTFLHNHAPDIAAMDLFVAPTIGFDLLYVLVIVRLERRKLVWINVTPHPTAEWIARQVTEAFPWDEAPRYLIRDRDRAYGAAFTHRLRAMGIRNKPIAPGSPWQNGFAERLIGSIRRECVDHIVVLGEAHLRQILTRYAAYYNELRTHRSLGKDAPISRAIQHVGRIISGPVLGGLHHHYCRNLIFSTDKVCIPQRGGKRTPRREAYESSAAFKNGQRFRAGIEGRISVLFRGRGMKLCLVEGRDRFELWVGAAVLANNLMRIGALLTTRSPRRRRAA